MQIRYFNEAGLDKMDRLIKYLTDNGISFTAHWVGPTAKQIERRQEKTNTIIDTEKLIMMKLTWFEA